MKRKMIVKKRKEVTVEIGRIIQKRKSKMRNRASN